MRYAAVVFDWAGTTIDFGSFAPMGVFVKAFAQFGVDVAIAQARGPMGKPKWDHIDAMLRDPDIAEGWRAAHGRLPTREDVDAVYRVFVPMNEAVVADYAALVPGTAETVATLRVRGYRIGSTTGYTRSIMERVLPLAAAQGYAPDNLVCADDLPFGRPTPMAMYKCCLDLGVADARSIIKVDDTEPGIAEGVAAGCLTIGVTLSGNYAGLTPDALAALSVQDRAEVRARAEAHLRAAGAHYVVDTVADLVDLIDRL
jgi:phosphonoacetaldehyde hydrolase